ncbi:MAG: hypothetical protein ACR2PY_09560 [Salinispira sp.]
MKLSNGFQIGIIVDKSNAPQGPLLELPVTYSDYRNYDSNKATEYYNKKFAEIQAQEEAEAKLQAQKELKEDRKSE